MDGLLHVVQQIGASDCVPNLLAVFFLISRTQMDPIRPVFSPLASEKVWPDQSDKSEERSHYSYVVVRCCLH